MKKSLAILLVGALSCAVFAQGGGQGRGGGRFMRGGGGSMSMLAMRSDVQKEIAVTSDQRAKLEAMAEKRREEMQARFEEMRNGGGGPPDRGAMETNMREMEAKNAKQLAEVLSVEQIARLKELGIQRAGNMSVLNPDVQKELGITDAQKSQIETLQGKQREAMGAVMDKMRNGEIEREAMGEIMQKNNKIMGDELAKILSQAQRDKLKAMAGKPFKFDEDENGPGGR